MRSTDKLSLCARLVENLGDLTRTYRTATFADSEAETYVESHGVDEFNRDFHVVTGHYHFNAFGEVNFTRAVHRAEIELGTVLVTEGSVTTTFFLLEDVDRSLELLVGLDNTGVGDHHTTLDFLLVDTTEEETNVVTSFTLIEELAEHFHTSYNRLLVFTETEDLNFVTNLNDTSFYTTSSNSTTTSDREHVFNRHQEGLIAIARRLLNPFVNSVHEVHYAFNTLSITVECTECSTADDRSIFFEIVLTEEVLHIHLNELEHFFVFNEVALIEEYNETRNVYLTSEKDVLTSLRHRTVSCSNYNDSTVHLRSTSYHVLHIVGVTWAVYVCVVTLRSFVFNVSSVNSDTTFLFFRSVVDLVERLSFRKTSISKHLSDSSSKSSLTVVNVTDSTNVYMRFGAHEFFFSHSFFLFNIK